MHKITTVSLKSHMLNEPLEKTIKDVKDHETVVT